ncbi:potassium channel family protein [Agromyces sp. M3QZ16-3]|uniref:potassium channel family protein n=1 Tax=Agromyces sp. M3QZ16-3 TaxID=3447585 RepID=UPI003F68F642
MSQQSWQKLVEWPLLVAALLFLAAYSWEVIAQLDGPDALLAESIIWGTWALFALDYVVNLALAEDRRRWFLRHLLDLAVVMLPVLRPLRLLRVVTILTVLGRTAGAMLRGKVILYAAAASVLLVYVAALAVLDAERGNGGSIEGFGEGLWWAFVTITTVGYGDFFPVTPTGQLVAVGVMIGGIALIGVVTGTLASWIVERVSETNEAEQVATKAHIDQLTAEIRELREEIRQRA